MSSIAPFSFLKKRKSREAQKEKKAFFSSGSQAEHISSPAFIAPKSGFALDKDFEKSIEALDAAIKRQDGRLVKDTVFVCPQCLGTDFEQVVEGIFAGNGYALPTPELRCKECGFEGIPLEMSAKAYKERISQK